MKDLNEYASKIASNFTHLDEDWTESLRAGLRSGLDAITQGGIDYARAGFDTAIKKIIGRDTTFERELKQEREKKAKSQQRHPDAWKVGQLFDPVKAVKTAATGLDIGPAATGSFGPRVTSTPQPETAPAIEPGQRKEDEMRKALKKQAADALNKKPGEQHPGVGDAPKAEAPAPTKKEASKAAEKVKTVPAGKPSDLTWSGYTSQKIATKGQGARQELARKTQSAAWDAAQNKKLSKAERTKAAFLAQRLQDKENREGR